MNATILGEDDSAVIVEVVDNNGVEHALAIEPNGTVQEHGQEGYPDNPGKRTREEKEYIGQVQQFAKYYAAQETEYDTLPWNQNPDRLETARNALAELSDEEIESYFGELRTQSLSHYRDHPEVDVGDIERPYALPENKIGDDDYIIYQQELYLDEAGDIEAVSGLIVEYYVARGQRENVRHGEDPLDRDPDARIALPPAALMSPGMTRDYLRYNLRCQIRDCYLMMGLEPPAEYKVLGIGQYVPSARYHRFDMYPEYFDKDAEIPGYSHEFAPEIDVQWRDVMGPGSSKSGSLKDRVLDAVFSR